MSSNKLTVTEVQQIQPWVLHFLKHVVKRCCMIIVAWIDEVNESSKAIEGESIPAYNGRLAAWNQDQQAQNTTRSQR